MSDEKMASEKVRAVAKLVNISLDESEVEKFGTTIPLTLTSIDVLKELNTTEVLPTGQVTGLHNVFRPVSSKTTLTQASALANAVETSKRLFVTKAVFDRT